MGFFSNLFTQKLEHPEDYYKITITEEFVQIEHPNIKTEQIAWSDIETVKLVNTDKGPWAPDVWLNLIGKNSNCMIPQGAKGYDEVYEIVSEYENFDFQKVGESMTCTENRHFTLWERNSVKNN